MAVRGRLWVIHGKFQRKEELDFGNTPTFTTYYVNALYYMLGTFYGTSVKAFSSGNMREASNFKKRVSRISNDLSIALQWLDLLSRGRHHRHTFSYFVLKYKKDLPLPRFELITFRVTTRCSTTELLWLMIFGLLFYCIYRWFGGIPKWGNTKIKHPLFVNQVTDDL